MTFVVVCVYTYYISAKVYGAFKTWQEAFDVVLKEIYDMYKEIHEYNDGELLDKPQNIDQLKLVLKELEGCVNEYEVEGTVEIEESSERIFYIQKV